MRVAPDRNVITLAASSWRTPPSRPRASPRSGASACDPRDARMLASISTAFRPAQRSPCLKMPSTTTPSVSDCQLRRAAYSFSYPHLFISPTVQQPVSMQASYRLWQTRCVPQCKRACEQVARCWADASLEDIAINGTPTVATRTALKIKRVMTSCEPTAARAVLSRSPSIATQACGLWDC